MITLLAQQAQPLALMSIFKPVVFLAVLAGWGWVVSYLDKDLEYYFLRRRMWNAIQIVAGALGFGLWLLMPFWVGIFVALVILSGAVAGYVYYRNSQVPPAAVWTASLDSFRNRIERVQAEKAQRHAIVHLLHKDQSRRPVPSGENNPAAAAHLILEQVMDFALPRAADRVELNVAAQKSTLAVQVDGVRYPLEDPDSKTALAIVDYLKESAAMEVADRRRRQTGTVMIDAGDLGRHTLGISSSGSTKGLTLGIEIDPEKRGSRPLPALGLLASQMRQLEAALDQPNRCVIVACPPLHGMTTTLYSLLQRHDPYTQSIMTLEDRVAFEVEGVSHENIDPGMDAKTLSNHLAAMLRKDPQVVLMSLLGDDQTARVLARAAQEVRLYFGLRAGDTFGALSVWQKAVGDAKLAAAAVNTIIAQRLVRKLCTTCRLAYAPDPEALKKLNLPADKVSQLFKQSGKVMVKNKEVACPDCLGMGYRGRIGVFEVMALDDGARRLVAAGQNEQLRSYLRKQKMLWLQEAALAKVIEGTTSISEITRVLNKPPEKTEGTAGAA